MRKKKKVRVRDADLILWALLITLVQIVWFDKTPTGWWAFLATGSAARMPLYSLRRGSHRGMLLACSSTCLRGKARVFHTTMRAFDFVCVRACLCSRVCICMCDGGWDCYGQKTYPHPTTALTLQPHSLQLYIFSLPLLPTPMTQTHNTHTRSHSPCSPP